jgi:hypothetical protein
MNDRKKLADHKFDEKIVYWRWVSAQLLAIVTKQNVYHIEITSGNKTLQMARKDNLAKGNC